MERSARPKNLSSSHKHAIMELLHGQNPPKKLGHLFDAHSHTGNDTRRPLFAEHLGRQRPRVVQQRPIPIERRPSPDEFVQVLSDARVTSEVSRGSESIQSPVPRKTSDTWTRLDQNLTDDGHQWRTYDHNSIFNSKFSRKYSRCAHQIDQECQAAKWVDRTSYDPRFFRIAYRDRHTCKNLILRSPPLIVDSPSARDDSIPLCFNTTSLFAEQDHENNPIFFDFLSVNQEQKLPGEDDVNTPATAMTDNSNNNNPSTSSDYCAVFESAGEI